MRRVVLPLLSGLALSACAPHELGDDRARMAEEAQARSEILADRFQKELLSALTAAMAAEGPQGAIGVCSSIAPALAAQLFASSIEAIALSFLPLEIRASVYHAYTIILYLY